MNIAQDFKRTRSHTAAQAQGASLGVNEVVHFWRSAHADWFSHDENFDQRFRERFLGLHLSAAQHECDDWASTPEGSLALLILLDQFPRNAFRGTPRMYATDPLARHFARMAHAASHMTAVDGDLRLFF